MLFMRNAPHKQILDKGDTAMASNQTSNYGLNQWEAEDRVMREEFNGDNAKVDAALAELAEEVGAKAAQTEVDGVKTQLAAKAAQSALDSLSSTVSVLDGTVDTLSASLTAGLAKKYGTDNPYIQTGTYTGNGAASRTISLGLRPSFIIIFHLYNRDDGRSYTPIYLFGVPEIHYIITLAGAPLRPTASLQFSSTGISITQYESGNTVYSFNASGESYRYLAFR